jgi:hypothetical protein
VALGADERYLNREEAAAAGDPAGTGAVRQAPTKAVFEGSTLSFDQIKARTGSLHCVTGAPEAGGQTRCYKNDDEMISSQASAGPMKAAAASAGSKRTRARAASCGNYEIQIHWEWGSFNAGSYGFEGRTYWQNLPAYMDDNTSSYTMGDRPGHMAENQGGGGWWYPGDTSVCALKSITYGPYPSWDNRISSGWRTL